MSQREFELPQRAREWLRAALGLQSDERPFPWQERLLRELVDGRVPEALDLPTGLGKTSVMAIWLVARACGAKLPRRLVYVVDRRAVVDQATAVAEHLRAVVEEDASLREALKLDGRSLAISTLRGQFVDNRRWMEDPVAPAIIVGTVDMIGSRLLFEGYGTSRKMRPYQAGLLGSDTLVVLDESHLVPPFAHLLQALTDQPELRPPVAADLALIPPFQRMALSATHSSESESVFTLTPDDSRHPVVARRLNAVKQLSLHEVPTGTKLAQALAERAWELSEHGNKPVRCLVFSDKRDVAEAACAALEKLAKRSAATNLFVGGRRIFERQAASEELGRLGFMVKPPAGVEVVGDRAAFVFATSAGEVGVDLDADHMVCDLVTWERMVQRFGRVNRRGLGEAKIVVLLDKDSIKGIEDRLKKKDVLLPALEALPEKDGARDASPGALSELSEKARNDEALRQRLADATTPEPLRPALTRPLVEAWAMTSLEEHTGRPEIAPWLRGWVDDDPQTNLVWRTHLPVRSSELPASNEEIDSFFEAAPPHSSEVLETPTYRVLAWIEKRVELIRKRHAQGSKSEASDSEQPSLAASAQLLQGGIVALLLAPDGKLKRKLTFQELDWKSAEKRVAGRMKAELERQLWGSTLVLDARWAGLREGLLNPDVDDLPRTLDDGEEWLDPSTVGFRVVTRTDEAPEAERSSPWRADFRMPLDVLPDGEPSRWLVVEQWKSNASNEEGRSAGPPQLLEEHQAWTREAAESIGQRLGLPAPYIEMLAVAAELHDEGKRARKWQVAFRASRDGVYAKTRGPIQYALLDGYRHEFGSLPYAERSEALRALPEDLRDLALHLIAAHHGFARPLIRTSGCEDAPASLLEKRARQVALRFVNLQKRWGPWGLAWWEALLRAADQQASRRNEQEHVNTSSAPARPPKEMH